MKKHMTTFCVVVLISLLATQAWGYTISSGFTESCHEAMTTQAITTNTDIPEDFQPVAVPIPDSEIWRLLAENLPADRGALEMSGESGDLILVSLVLGVRAPDTEGHSVTNLATLRDAHTNPAGQYPHFLRSTLDDGDAGNIKAIDGSIKHFRDTVQIALAYLKFPPEAQIISTLTYADFYGQVRVEVWAPMFFLGIAIHALQDSFSHTVRSDDLMKIRHVMNFIDAVNTGHEPGRDGLAHSGAMDNCQEDAKEIADVAIMATQELLNATANSVVSDDLAPIDTFIDRWFQYEPGCNSKNNFCDSKWTPIARREPTGPFIAGAFDCSQCSLTRHTDPKAGIFFVLMAAAVALARRKRRQA